MKKLIFNSNGGGTSGRVMEVCLRGLGLNSGMDLGFYRSKLS